MESYRVSQNLSVFAHPVPTFPNGIKEAFSSLMNTFGHRAYYGISWFDQTGAIIYYAGAEKISADEKIPAGMEVLTIPPGDYDIERVHNWQQKTDQIKDVFGRLMGERSPDKSNPCIEWYKSDQEMVCMIKN